MLQHGGTSKTCLVKKAGLKMHDSIYMNCPERSNFRQKVDLVVAWGQWDKWGKGIGNDYK